MVPNDMQGGNYDRHVFKLILLLTSIFMTAYILGISIPYWFVLQENVTNFSNCISSYNYNDYNLLRNSENDQEVDDNEVTLTVKASLWYVLIHVRSNYAEVSTWVMFKGLRTSPYTKHKGVMSVNEKLIVSDEQPNRLGCLVMFTLLAFGLIFGWRASMKPSRRIYYGTSVICIVLGTTIWINIAMPNGKINVILVAVEHCAHSGQVLTAPFFHLVIGSLGILTLVFGLLLIYLSTLTSFSIQVSTEFYPHKVVMSEKNAEGPFLTVVHISIPEHFYNNNK